MFRNKLSRVCLLFVLLGYTVYPCVSYGRLKEKAVDWDSTNGHTHDGVSGGVKLDAINVANTPSGDVSATNVQAAVTELDSEKISESDKGAPNGVASLDASSRVLAIQLPAIAITDVNICANESCQTSLVAEEGDVCIRSDENKSYIHNGGVVGDMTDWNLLLATGLVTSVNSETGDVVNVERTTRLQTTISDSDANYPSSGAVVDYVATHAADASAHHDKTTLFTDLSDSATDAQIPNDITIEFAADADTVDTKHFTDITADTDSRISTHASGTDEHHAKSHAHNGADGSGTVAHSDTTGRTADDHHDDLSNTYNITPATVTTTGDIKINSNLTTSKLSFGTAGDTSLYRSAADILETDDTFKALSLQTTDGVLASYRSTVSVALGIIITGDSYWRYQVDSSGVTRWSAGSSSADTNLYRSAANLLQTDDTFRASSGVQVGNSSSALIDWDGTNIQISNAPLEMAYGDASNYKHATTTKYKITDCREFRFDGLPNPARLFIPGALEATVANILADSGYAVVYLPIGATVTAFTGYGSTAAGVNNEVEVELRRMAFTTTVASNILATATFSDGASNDTDSTISNPVISEDYRYYIEAGIRSSSLTSNARLTAARVTYTTTNLAQTQ